MTRNEQPEETGATQMKPGLGVLGYMTLGITGLSGSGKTAVTRILQNHGAYAVIADELSHAAIQPGNPPYDGVVKAFGTEILDGGGEIDRRKLGGLVFGNPEQLYILEGIIHPYVAALTEKLISEAMDTGAYRFAVIDAPMLVEAGMDKKCDAVWLVTAPEDLKIERIIKRDGITREAAEKRLAARDEMKLFPFADEIITNGGSLEDLEREVIKKLTTGVYKN